MIRGGYGIFYGGFENSVVETYVDFPFQFYLDYPSLDARCAHHLQQQRNRHTLDGVNSHPARDWSVEPGGVMFLGEDYHMKTPYTQGYNLTLQYQLTPSDTIQVGYVGNTVRHLGVYTNWNTPREILPPGLNSFDYSPYPDFTNAAQYTSFAADSNYHSLQTNYERRLGGGLTRPRELHLVEVSYECS